MTFLEGFEVTNLLEHAGVWGYPLVFLLAMIPAIEPFIVIPVAIGLGLDPILTGIAAFAGSVSAVGIVVRLKRPITAWWARRRGEPITEDSTRYRRARRLWDHYGLPGLAFVGPPLAGIHLTALFGALTGSNDRRTMGWLSVGLAAWTAFLVIGSVVGFSLLGVT